jgi:hypothetical protein
VSGSLLLLETIQQNPPPPTTLHNNLRTSDLLVVFATPDQLFSPLGI